MKVLLVVGARPNFMKVAPIIAAIHEHNDRVNRGLLDRSETLDYVLVHTGQHYDRKMSDSFFEDLRMPQPDVNLGVGSGSHAVQTGEIMKRFEPVLLEEAPDLVLVAGDVNSTLACSLVAAKLECGPLGVAILGGVAHDRTTEGGEQLGELAGFQRAWARADQGQGDRVGIRPVSERHAAAHATAQGRAGVLRPPGLRQRVRAARRPAAGQGVQQRPAPACQLHVVELGQVGMAGGAHRGLVPAPQHGRGT